MTKAEMENLLRNVDRRTTNIERILPTLATKEELGAAKTELREAIAQAVAPLATKDELRALEDRMHQRMATLATKDALRALEERMHQRMATKDELRAEGERTRRHFDVVAERLEGQIRLVAEGVGAINERMDRQYAELTRKDAELDGRVTRLEAESAARRRRRQP